MPIKPTLSVPIFGGEVTMHAFGREHSCNFSFKGIDTSHHPQESHQPIFSALCQFQCDFAAPSPALMNAEILTPHQVANYPDSRVLRIGFSTQTLYRGSNADGVAGLGKKIGYAMSAADCALIVVRNGDFIAAAHAGRNSIIDMDRMKGKAPRENESVVHTICRRISKKKLRVEETQVWAGFSISPGLHFPHAVDDPRNPHNRHMVEYVRRKYGTQCFKSDEQDGALGWLDTKALIRAQFMLLGVPEENIELDSMCTYSDVNNKGEPVWFSNVRNTKEGKDGRNLVAVVVNR